LAALVTLELQSGISYGDGYGALLQQVGGPEQAVLGALEIDIPVQKVDLLLPAEEKRAGGAAVRGSAIPTGGRQSCGATSPGLRNALMRLAVVPG
jgi:hypothetical protein